MKLLIVDDSALVRRTIEQVYKGQTFTDIRTASDGLLAVTLYKEFAPDVVTLDITMPYMDGLAALVEMLEFNDRAKILIISALADHHTAIEALKRGADQFICKPFTDEDLREALDDIVFEAENFELETSNPISDERSETRAILDRTREKSEEVKRSSARTTARHPDEKRYPSGYVAPPQINTSSPPISRIPEAYPSTTRKPIMPQTMRPPSK